MQKTKKEKLEKEIKKEETSELEELISGSEAEENVPNRTKEEKREIENLRDQLLRRAAEFENFKRRTESEISTLFKYANEGLITELLPVLDDFNRVLKADNNQDTETLRKGVELIYEKFKKTLEKQGLKDMESTGKPFDVNLHDALLQQESSEVEPNTVIDTVEKGYFLKDKVIRHAKVIVSKKEDDK